MILLAVSGGIDSMYLANRARELFPGTCFAIAHCNFHLRGEESDADTAFVTSWADKSHIELYVKHFDTLSYARSHGISTEMAARDLRYNWFAKLCDEKGFEAVAVAHNANDNAETLLLNLLRGSGSKGLRGMSEESILNIGEKPLRILRPMLGISRKEIVEWMTAHSENWREDSTNAVSDCKRNIIRNEVFPLLEGINPSFIRTLNRDMVHFRLTDDIADEYFRNTGMDLQNGIDIRQLKALPHWEYVLFRLVEPYNLNEETFIKLVELLKSDRTMSGKVFQSPTHLITIKLKKIIVAPRQKTNNKKLFI